jgi:hypothetical protein
MVKHHDDPLGMHHAAADLLLEHLPGAAPREVMEQRGVDLGNDNIAGRHTCPPARTGQDLFHKVHRRSAHLVSRIEPRL